MSLLIEGDKRPFQIGTLPSFSITGKLWSVIVVFICIVAALLALSYFGMQTLSTIRAYVGGEGLWSKAEKDAVTQLHAYAFSRDENDFARYRAFIAVPLGDKKARLELEKPDADLALADQGFIEGRNDTEDVRDMSLLFRRFRHVSYLEWSIAIWEEGDAYIAQLVPLADELHEGISSGTLPEENIKKILGEINRINTELTVLEDNFSFTLGEAARWLTNILIQIMFVVAALLLLLGLMISRFIISDIARIDRAKSEFVSIASHQLRTPPTGIKWYTAMLLDEDVGTLTPTQRKYLDQIAYNNQRMVEVVDTVLKVSQIELGAFQNKPVPTDVCAAIDKLLTEFDFEIRNKHITLSRRYACGASLLTIDPALLRIVVYNLISNSVKYTPVEGTITLSVVLSGSTLLMTVVDTGSGIPKREFPYIFRKFFRASNIEKQYARGIGLGLYTVKRILDQIGGTVSFTSELDKGTTFSVSIPVSAGEKHP